MPRNHLLYETSKLLWRHLFNALPPDEHTELDDWVGESDSNMHAFEKATDNHELQEGDEFLSSVDKKKKLADIMSNARFKLVLNARIRIEGDTKALKLKKRYWSIAAAIIGIITIPVYFTIIDPSAKPKPFADTEEQQQEDIQPAGNKATLTLEDGTIISLDSTNRGTIATRNNATITNEAGHLKYTANGNPATGINHTLTTPRAGFYSTTLSDGTKIWLNANSSLQYPVSMTSAIRKVILTGEAYFEVAHVKGRKSPFIVEVKGRNTQIEVLGTNFNINAYGDEPYIRTSLFQGEVKIHADGKTALLKPGQEAKVLNGTLSIADMDAAGIAATKAWKEGRFDFKIANLRSLMRQVSRWYDVEVEYKSNVRELPFSGWLNNNVTLSELLGALRNNGINSKVVGRKVILGD